jgi:hypothetical protein
MKIFAKGRVCQNTPLWTRRILVAFALLVFLAGMTKAASAQMGGASGIQGTVTDQTGAAVPHASVTATNDDTHVSTTREATGEGLYLISPILPGTYTITVSAPGFSEYVQKNIICQALNTTGLSIALKPGSQTETVTVTAAPPALQTENAQLGGIVENKAYNNLPIQMSGQQRDPTAFATLLPGAQSGSRAPVIGGTSNYLAELYLDGLPVTVATQQGDNRIIFNAVAMEAIDSLQVVTSSIPPEFQGAGMLNFTVKSGASQYHGSANIFLRNTIFDTWTYTQKRPTSYDANGNKIVGKKPYENQNELSVSAGGPIPLTQHKGFFQYTWDRYHGRAAVNPGLMTIPTLAMRQGDFSALLKKNGGPGYILYDPQSQSTCMANNKGNYCRYAYGQTWQGAPTTSESVATNVIPSSYISPIAKAWQKGLPTPSNSNLQNNYLGGMPSGYDNWSFTGRVDYDVTPSQRLSAIWARGSRLNVPYTYGATTTLPYPYAYATAARVRIDLANFYHTWTINSSMVNQFKFGFLYFGGPPVRNITQGDSTYSATGVGMTNLPVGQDTEEMPGVTFSGSNAPTAWGHGATSTYTSRSLGYTYGDNLQWTKGKHAIEFGFQFQFLEANADAADGTASALSMTYSTSPTAAITGVNATTANTGYSYASYLLGGVGSSSTTIQTFAVTGGRYHPFAPYVADNWKVNSKLTLNLGVRWDYIPPFTETKDRWSFLNPGLTNTATGNLGMMQFAGHGNYTCNCRTPVQTYWKNWGPRLGLSYQYDDKTVIHAGYGLFYSHGGGVGGRAGSYSGTGSNGFSASASPTSEVGSAPSYWLNNSTGFASLGISNTALGGPAYTLPTPTGVSAAGQVLGTGAYLVNGVYQTPLTANYADPIVSGRAPTFAFYNFGIQRVLTPNITLSLNYSGSESHFLATGTTNGPSRGYWSNQLDPKYMVGLATTKVASGSSAGGNILTAQASDANIATAKAAMSGIAVPYAGYQAAGNASASATIQRMLTAFPQYNAADFWGNVGNNSYHALQLSLIQRNWKGLQFQLHYTYSKNIGDDGSFRSGYDIPADAIDAGGKSFHRGKADRSWTTNSIPQALSIFGTYDLPFGKNKLGANNFWIRNVAGGWLLSGIFKYTSGSPLAILPTSGYAVAGQAMPNLNPAFAGKSARVGKWGIDDVQHVNPNAFIAPKFYGSSQVCTKNCTSMIGNAPRTRAYGLSGPSYYNLDMSMKRSFPIVKDRVKLQIEANCQNVTHKHTFGGIGVTLPAQAADASGADASTIYYNTNTSGTPFGKATTASGNRDFQFAAHIVF